RAASCSRAVISTRRGCSSPVRPSVWWWWGIDSSRPDQTHRMLSIGSAQRSDLCRHGPPLLLPEGEPSVDQADLPDSQIAKQPPEPGGVELTIGVVDQHLGVGADPQRRDPRLPGGAVGQRLRLGSHPLDSLGINPDSTRDVALVVLAPGPGVQETEMWLAEATLEVIEGHELDGRPGRTRSRSNQCRGEHDDEEAVHETLPSVTGVQAL